MGKYGWKIHNYKAATVLGKNLGIRDRYDYTDAILHHSLFTRFLKSHGMSTDKKDEATRDIICLDFGFGLRSYKEELKHLESMRNNAIKKISDEDELNKRLLLINNLQENLESKKDEFKKMSRDEIRKKFYIDGCDIQYPNETIHYKMLYRNPSKAKQGSVMFIREELYDIAYKWLTMGLGNKLPRSNAKIVEISAYSPLTASAIESTVTINIDDVLILKDQDSYFRTVADIVKTCDYEETVNKRVIKGKKCIVERELTDVKNTIWDGMALIESSILPKSCNGMALLRNHFFKACAFKTYIQKFIKNYCMQHNIDYDSYIIFDMYGIPHLAKNIKMITTDNATKFKKFKDLVGTTDKDIYKYWREKVIADGCVFGIVKTDHPSKLGEVQQMSYQMINSLPTTKHDIELISKTSVDYIDKLKSDTPTFIRYLRQNSSAINHYDMLADLYELNHDFEKSKMFKYDRSEIISKYVNKLRKGKLVVYGDNLTMCGNPYGLLLYTVGENYEDDPTLRPDDGVIQVYTKRFEDREFLCGIRSPQNGQSNLGYFKNVKHPLFDEYFDFSNNILAVNCIHTDVQARMNGMDLKIRSVLGKPNSKDMR